MNKILKVTMSLVGIAPIAVATVLPAATIGRTQMPHLPETYMARVAPPQTLLTAQASLFEGTSFSHDAFDLSVEEIPLPEPVAPVAPAPAAVTPEAQETAPNPSVVSSQYTLGDLMFQGVINWEGLKFTYYSQSVLPGGGLSIPGRHVNAGGYVSDGDGYIVMAGSAPMGTVYNTPFGYPGKIYDRGTVGNHLDIYTM